MLTYIEMEINWSMIFANSLHYVEVYKLRIRDYQATFDAKILLRKNLSPQQKVQ